MARIILASQSPRRREILKLVGLDFEVIPSDCEEIITTTDPSEVVCELSRQKAEDIAKKISGSDNEKETVIIGSDTIVYYNGEIMGKPKDEIDAFATLKKLSGHTHQVYTGVTVIRISGDGASINKRVESASKSMSTVNSDTVNHIITETFYERTDVTFYDVTDKEIQDYIATGHPMDKAGSYGLQGLGAFLVKKINGDYFTVIGLPIAHLLRVLKNL